MSKTKWHTIDYLENCKNCSYDPVGQIDLKILFLKWYEKQPIKIQRILAYKRHGFKQWEIAIILNIKQQRISEVIKDARDRFKQIFI